MDIKSRFETHPVVFGLGLIVTGFIAGFGTRGYLNFSNVNAVAFSNCNTEGISITTKAHNDRLEAFRIDLRKMESEATSMGHIESTQKVFQSSADRIRKDIAQESVNFQIEVASLNKKCEQ